ncbi:hypothetical protein [Simplicispira psychrophila]|uniref:hypothetical protein n=1 Tax=Simplicispira psychrophila TaxID=80882 RepID=UPI00047F5C49|nr:hypothetical protein [Simplicispira psychrophila]
MTSDSCSALLQSGNALVAQAQAVATHDFAAARALWRAAGALFLRAHAVDPEHHTAALRLGQAWMAEAHALQKEDSEDAVALWRQAAAQCEAAFALDPQHAATAMQVASAYAWAQDAEAAQAWAQIGRHLAQQPTADSADDAETPETAAD